MAFMFEMETTAKSILQYKHRFYFLLCDRSQTVEPQLLTYPNTNTHTQAKSAIEYIRSLPTLSGHIMFQIATV